MKTIEAVDLSTLTIEDFLRASSPEGKAEIQQVGKITIIDLLWLPAAQLQKMLDREAKSGPKRTALNNTLKVFQLSREVPVMPDMIAFVAKLGLADSVQPVVAAVANIMFQPSEGRVRTREWSPNTFLTFKIIVRGFDDWRNQRAGPRYAVAVPNLFSGWQPNSLSLCTGSGQRT